MESLAKDDLGFNHSQFIFCFNAWVWHFVNVPSPASFFDTRQTTGEIYRR